MILPAYTMVTPDAEGPAGPIVYFLHGFLGAGRNWASFGRRLVERRPDWAVALVDLRLHGESRQIEGPHSVTAAAEDVAALHRSIAKPGTPYAVLGHSFGGKVALRVASLSVPDLRQVWIVDSTPAPSRGAGSSSRMLDVLAGSPDRFSDREAAVRHVMQSGFDEPTARWMATNLRRSGESWSWGLDRAGLREMLESFAQADLWGIVEDGRSAADLHFVRASEGSIVSDDVARRLRQLMEGGAPVRLHELSGGHWLHIDNPDGLLDLVADALPVIAG